MMFYLNSKINLSFLQVVDIFGEGQSGVELSDFLSSDSIFSLFLLEPVTHKLLRLSKGNWV
jgi:hypothetical protein